MDYVRWIYRKNKLIKELREFLLEVLAGNYKEKCDEALIELAKYILECVKLLEYEKKELKKL